MREMHRAVLVPESRVGDVERFLADFDEKHDPDYE